MKGGQQGRELPSGKSESDGTESDGAELDGAELDGTESDGAELEGEATVRGGEARERGLSERGRGSLDGDRPPAVLWVEREEKGKHGARVIELRRGVDQKSLFRSAWRHVEPGSRIDTGGFSGYGLLDAAYDHWSVDHRSVDHEDTYVTEEGVHCNTAEAK